jgi:hypothetical protein
MSLHMALIVAVASTAAVSGLHTVPQEPSGVARQQRSVISERVAEDQSRTRCQALFRVAGVVRRGWPEKSISEEGEAREWDEGCKSKDKSRDGGKKDPQ